VGQRHAGLRLDGFLSALSHERSLPISRTEWQRRIASGDVTIPGRRAVAPLRLKEGDRVLVRRRGGYDAPPVLPEEIALDVRHEDPYLAVIVKPAGMLVHPAYGKPSGTLVNALLARWPGGKPYTVHRLDRDVSGLILVARDAKTARALSEAIARKEVERTYRATVAGTVKKESFTILTGLTPEIRVRGVKKRTVMVTTREGGQMSKTRVRVLERLLDRTVVEVQLATGRQNQIRAHLASVGHPILGDTLYDGPAASALALTAVRLAFRHPGTGHKMVFEL